MGGSDSCFLDRGKKEEVQPCFLFPFLLKLDARCSCIRSIRM